MLLWDRRPLEAVLLVWIFTCGLKQSFGKSPAHQYPKFRPMPNKSIEAYQSAINSIKNAFEFMSSEEDDDELLFSSKRKKVLYSALALLGLDDDTDDDKEPKEHKKGRQEQQQQPRRPPREPHPWPWYDVDKEFIDSDEYMGEYGSLYNKHQPQKYPYGYGPGMEFDGQIESASYPELVAMHQELTIRSPSIISHVWSLIKRFLTRIFCWALSNHVICRHGQTPEEDTQIYWK